MLFQGLNLVHSLLYLVLGRHVDGGLLWSAQAHVALSGCRADTWSDLALLCRVTDPSKIDPILYQACVASRCQYKIQRYCDERKC
jgi:hypothetical protein